ncbi:MAG: Gx transporter family protein [Lachnospiraceae bacterium]|nr:Gx transporter family protein [Lachnospiraceae bacterium]
MRRTGTQRIATFGILIALALILSYVEAQLPVFFAVPGMKLGLTNIVVLYALYRMGTGSALGINAVRVVLVGMLFGNGVSLLYSLAGALLSGLVMIGLKKTERFGLITVSVAGGIAHNVGQVAAAAYLLRTDAVLWYLAILWFCGMAAGAVIGILGAELVKRVP